MLLGAQAHRPILLGIALLFAVTSLQTKIIHAENNVLSRHFKQCLYIEASHNRVPIRHNLAKFSSILLRTKQLRSFEGLKISYPRTASYGILVGYKAINLIDLLMCDGYIWLALLPLGVRLLKYDRCMERKTEANDFSHDHPASY